MRRSFPAGVASMSPAAATSRLSTQRSLTFVREVDDVEVLDQTVDQFDERADEQRLAEHHKPNLCGTKLSARCAGQIDLGRTTPVDVFSYGELLSRRVVEPEPPVDHIPGDVVDEAFGTKGVGSQPDQGFADPDPELDRDHSRRLVDDELEVGFSLERRRHGPRRGVGLENKYGLGGQVGKDQGIGLLIVAQRSRAVPIEIEGSQPGGTDAKGEAETRPGLLPL